MALDPLPLVDKILRDSGEASVVNAKASDYGGYIETEKDGINAVKKVFSIRYMPMILSDRNILMNFMLLKRAGTFFSFTPCGTATTYKVRRIPDTLQETRNGALYSVRFELMEQF